MTRLRPGLCSRARYRCANRAGVSQLGDMRERMGHLQGRSRRGRSSCRLSPTARIWRSIVSSVPIIGLVPATVRRPVRAAHRPESAGLANPACAVTPSGCRRPAPQGVRAAPRRAAAQSARHWRSTTKSGRPCSPSISTRRWCGVMHRVDAQRCLLPGPHVPALPLQEHGITVAVPAVPRMEYLRRGADVAARSWRRKSGINRLRNRVAGLT